MNSLSRKIIDNLYSFYSFLTYSFALSVCIYMNVCIHCVQMYGMVCCLSVYSLCVLHRLMLVCYMLYSVDSDARAKSSRRWPTHSTFTCIVDVSRRKSGIKCKCVIHKNLPLESLYLLQKTASKSVA